MPPTLFLIDVWFSGRWSTTKAPQTKVAWEQSCSHKVLQIATLKGYSMWCNKLSPKSPRHPRSRCGHQQQQIIAINISSRQWQWGMTWCSSGKIKISRLWQIITQLLPSITAKGETQRESSWQGFDLSLFVRQLVEFELLERGSFLFRSNVLFILVTSLVRNCWGISGSVWVKWPR